MATFIGGDSNGRMRTLLQILELKRQREAQQAQNLLARAQPGQTLSQIGLSAKQFKTLFGRDPKGDEVIEPETAQSVIAARQLETLRTAKPEFLDIAAASTFSAQMGVPQITTTEGLTTQGRTSETESKTRSRKAQTELEIETSTAADQVSTAQSRSRASAVSAQTLAQAVQSGAAKFLARPAEEQATIGETAILGQPGSAIINQDLQNKLMSEMYRESLKFTANPQGHPLGRLLRSELGLDPNAVIGAAGAGLLSLISDVTQLRITQATARAASETSMDKVLADYALKLSEATGLKLSPRAVRAELDARELRGESLGGDIGVLFDTASEMVWRATMTEAQRKGDPNAALFEQLISLARNTDDKRMLQAFSDVGRMLSGQILTSQMVGPRPLAPGPAQEAWDRAAMANGQFMTSGVKSKNNWIRPDRIEPAGMGFDLMNFLEDNKKPKQGELAPGQNIGVDKPGSAAFPTVVGAGPIGDLSPEDKKTLTDFLALMQGATP